MAFTIIQCFLIIFPWTDGKKSILYCDLVYKQANTHRHIYSVSYILIAKNKFSGHLLHGYST